MTKPPQCISSDCEFPLFSLVTYCPFCGIRQQNAPPPITDDRTYEVDIPREIGPESTPDIPHSTPFLVNNLTTPATMANPVVTTTTLRAAKPWWAVGMAFFAVFAAALYIYQSGAGAGCDAPSRNVLVVLDFLGPPSLTTGEIVNRIQTLFDKTRNGERFVLFDTRSDTPIFEACSSPLTLSTQTGVRKRLTETVLNAITKKASPRPESLPNLAQSPRQKISQKITDLSLTIYMRASENNLHLFSDLFEGNPALFETLCKPPSRAVENFRLARRGGMEQASFINTDVNLHLVPRQDVSALSLNCRDKYWRWLLANTSGKGAGVSIEYLPSLIRSSNE